MTTGNYLAWQSDCQKFCCLQRWSKLLERIARVSEAVNSGEDIELIQPDDQHDQEPIDQPDDENEKSSSVQDINILSCRLDRTEQSLDSLGSHQLPDLSDMTRWTDINLIQLARAAISN